MTKLILGTFLSLGLLLVPFTAASAQTSESFGIEVTKVDRQVDFTRLRDFTATIECNKLCCDQIAGVEVMLQQVPVEGDRRLTTGL